MTVSPVYQARPHKAAEARTRAYWAEMMRDDDLAAEIGGRFDHILVDEYQDTNRLQSKILLRSSSRTISAQYSNKSS